MTVHVVLFEPEIPQNTGNIARTCACTGAHLHLVEPMGFRLSVKQLGRASMDYWDDVDITRWPCTEAFLGAHASDDLRFFTGRASRSLADDAFEDETYVIFGRESRGIDEGVLRRYESQCVRIPMMSGKRSLNLSNAAAVVIYDVMRRRGYAGFE